MWEWTSKVTIVCKHFYTQPRWSFRYANDIVSVIRMLLIRRWEFFFFLFLRGHIHLPSVPLVHSVLGNDCYPVYVSADRTPLRIHYILSLSVDFLYYPFCVKIKQGGLGFNFLLKYVCPQVCLLFLSRIISLYPRIILIHQNFETGYSLSPSFIVGALLRF